MHVAPALAHHGGPRCAAAHAVSALQARLRNWRKSTPICAISAAPCSLHGAPTRTGAWQHRTGALAPPLHARSCSLSAQSARCSHCGPHGGLHHFRTVFVPRPAVSGPCHAHAPRSSRAAWLQPRARWGCDLDAVSRRWCRIRTACEVSGACPPATACHAHRHVDLTRAHRVHQQHAPAAARGRASARQRGGHFLLAAI